MDDETKKVVAVARLDEYQRKYEAGDGMALLGAIRICANYDLPLPAWAAEAYISAYDTVLNCRSNSWDDVFGKPYHGKHLEKRRERLELQSKVWLRVRELRNHDPDIPLNGNREKDGALEIVAEECDIKRTLCSELYYEMQKLVG